MTFSYLCQKCENRFDGDYPIGKAPRSCKCPKCGGKSSRVYEGMGIAIKVGSSFSHGSRTFGEEMKARNIKAAQRMKGKKPPVRLAAMDYGNGDIREVS